MSPQPGKETGALLHAPIRKVDLAETAATRAPVQACAHSVTRTERLPDGGLQYAHEVCATCGRHVRWLPKPKTIERQRWYAFRLSRLAMCDRLNSWARNFVRDISGRRKLSPKQQEIVDRLCAQYLEGKTP
jgi:hypothetical protein